MRSAGIPGLTLAVTDRERTLHVVARGVSDIASGAPVQPETPFEIGSLGKPFTVVPLLKQRDAGRLDLHRPVAEILPWFATASDFPPATVHQLLNHTSGIVRGTDLAPHGLFEAWNLRNLPTRCPPGESFWYSNVGYKVLGFVAERLYGRSLPEIVQTEVLEPLGMDATRPAKVLPMQGETATGYTSVYDDRPEHLSHRLVPSVWAEYATGDGAQVSTAGDMAKYVRCLLNRGEGPSGPLISPESFDLMTSRSQWTGGDFYGYGIASYDVDGRMYLGHGGGSAGFRSALVVDLEAGLGVALLVNRMGVTDPLVDVAQRALTAVHHEMEGTAMPPLPIDEPTRVSYASQYAGVYRAGGREFELVAENETLRMRYAGQEPTLERRTRDTFYVPYPDFELALLEFGRGDGDDVVEAFHGGDWYKTDRYNGPIDTDHPPSWDAYLGHYRARSPEVSNFRIVARKGGLVFLHPWGISERLHAIAPDTFRRGDNPCSPETIRFEAFADGQALVADYSGCPFYRTFTP